MLLISGSEWVQSLYVFSTSRFNHSDVAEFCTTCPDRSGVFTEFWEKLIPL